MEAVVQSIIGWAIPTLAGGVITVVVGFATLKVRTAAIEKRIVEVHHAINRVEGSTEARADHLEGWTERELDKLRERMDADKSNVMTEISRQFAEAIRVLGESNNTYREDIRRLHERVEGVSRDIVQEIRDMEKRNEAKFMTKELCQSLHKD